MDAPAPATDFQAVCRLLTASGLPTGDLGPDHLEHFLVVGPPSSPEGVVAVEVLGGVGLLRSLAVAPGARGRGLGTRLVEAAEARARAHGVGTLYLLTETAEAFFARHGYRPIAREAAPPAVQATPQAAALCPDSAVLMHKTLAPEAARPPRADGGF